MSAPPGYQSTQTQSTQTQTLGATALAAAPHRIAEDQAKTQAVQTAKTTTRLQTPLFANLFSREAKSRVIPFDAQQRELLLRNEKRQMDSVLSETAEIKIPIRAGARPYAKPIVRKASAGDPQGEQSTLDFLPSQPQAARTLKTSVEAVIYCDITVAPASYRTMAALMDSSMVLLGLGLFLFIFQMFGGPLVWSKQNTMLCGAAAALIAMVYGFVWALCGRETAGMRWAGLRVLNFNGYPPDGKSRALRLLGCWLSYSSGMIGILWALVDEESLTWHDHMSKTFPALQEPDSPFVRQRP